MNKINLSIENNFLQLVDILDIVETEEYVNMVDITVDEDNSFMLSNGIISHNSAIGNFRTHRNEDMGAFALRGKFINCTDISIQKLSKNTEAVNIMAAMGLKFGQRAEKEKLRYGKIYLYVDADCLDESTLVLTRDGSKKISDVTYDDEMLTHTGNYKRVLNIVEKDISNYTKIVVNGNEIICSTNHKLIVVRDGNILEICAKDLKYSDFLLLKDKK